MFRVSIKRCKSQRLEPYFRDKVEYLIYSRSLKDDNGNIFVVKIRLARSNSVAYEKPTGCECSSRLQVGADQAGPSSSGVHYTPPTTSQTPTPTRQAPTTTHHTPSSDDEDQTLSRVYYPSMWEDDDYLVYSDPIDQRAERERP